MENLDNLENLPADWDSDGAQPPNTSAIARGEAILRILDTMNFKPSSIAPSRDEGITIAFDLPTRWAAIECYNTAEIVAVTSDRTGNPTVWEVSADDHSIRAALEKIQAFLC